MDDRLIGVLRGLLPIAVLLVIAALFDLYRKRKHPGLRQPKKLTRREIFWAIIIVLVLFLLGIPVGRLITRSPRSDNRPITLSDK